MLRVLVITDIVDTDLDRVDDTSDHITYIYSNLTLGLFPFEVTYIKANVKIIEERE